MSSPKRSPQSSDTGRSGRQVRVHFAAVGALIVSIGFLVVVLSLVADDPTGLILAFIWLFAFAFCGWFLVTRRGYRRLLVLPVMLWSLVNLFGFAYDHKVVLPVLLGVLALFGIVARYAVRNARPVQPARAPPCACCGACQAGGAHHQSPVWWR